MIKLIRYRSKGLIDAKIFKDIDEVNSHIEIIEKAKFKLNDDIRTLELKNWLDYIKK
jgi:transcriptional regulator